LNILITGDFCPINRAEDALLENTVFDLSLVDLFHKVDLNITNLECPLTHFDKAINKSGPALKANPKLVKALKSNYFNLVTLANNHIMDYGSQGLKDTLKILDRENISHVGAGEIKDENDVFYYSQGGVKIAVINLCENEWSTIPHNGYAANGFSEIDAFYSINKAKVEADQIIVIHHGGHEMHNLPSPRLKKTLRFFVDCGADVVINHHTHCISVNEVYQDKPIYYSLGNFVFDNPNFKNSIWNYGMMVKLSIDSGKISTQEFYFKQFGERAKVERIDKIELPIDFAKLYDIFQDDKKLEDHFKAFIKSKTRMYKTYLEPLKFKYYNALVNRGIAPSLWHPKKRLLLNNLMRCESHREILKSILFDETSDTQQ
jgi:poly-gamma-glutamate synthesis protein (capsule biosynthesis protein)